ncbi:MAG: glycosyltransferase family 4 protein [Oscillochloridaceae bacterium umkhey_bin13]
MYQVGFIIEQVLGHITHTRNLQQTIPLDPEIQAHWGPVPYAIEGISARLPFYRNWTLRGGLRARRILQTMASQTRLDRLFFHTQVPATLCLDWVRRIPSIVSLDATPLQYDELGLVYAHRKSTPTIELLKWRLSRSVFSAAAHLVTWSAWARQGLIQGYQVAPERITVIPPGVVSADWQAPLPRQLHPGPLKLLFVGGDFERKGGKLLLEAHRQLYPQTELHLVTRDEVATEAGVFVYHGMQPNSSALKQLYFDSDVFVLPTYGDCLPLVLAEAGAAGLPTLATRVAAIPEIVRESETGLLIPVGDAAALTNALRTLLAQPTLRLQLGANAAQYIATHHDSRTNGLRLAELLKAQHWAQPAGSGLVDPHAAPLA